MSTVSNTSSPVILTAPIFGSSDRKASVGLSSADSSDGPLLSNHSPTAKDMLLQVQRDNSSSPLKLKQTLRSHDKTLRQKGIIMIGPNLPDSDPPTLRPRGSPKFDNFTSVAPPVLSPSSLITNQTETHVTRPHNGPFSNDERFPLSPSLLTLNTSLLEGLGSPDSGCYDDLAGSAARNRSSTTETYSTRRTNVSSGVPSSIWSRPESELAKEEEFDEEMRKKRGASNTSNTSSDQSDIIQSSFHFPLSSMEEPLALRGEELSHFYSPDEDTILQVAPRRGIQRSNSTEESVSKRSLTDTRSRKKNGGGVRGRSASLFVKGMCL